MELNGKPLATEAATLADLLEETGYKGAVVATALNGTFLPKGLRAATPLADGDAVEVVAPMQGG
ncbi:MAG: sulfur carrier protein ThiS [Alphaproteobacteria bacterium]|nr:sulfur carrier protein ThiS [Alphaproteobacteria bacterium]MCY4230624.1 sulfur carrier protein ThiS [Alphaproteobacteria bacterium]MCY4318395.1 sulfur carrier protein ThiS [Alphaproteobacteria bacterium]